MRKISINFFVLSLALFVCNFAFADVETQTKRGSLTGRIIDSSYLPLPGATLLIEELKQGTSSDVNGFYRVEGIKPGVYTLRVSYIGYDSVVKKITIGEGVLEENIELKEGIVLDEVIVTGFLQGQNKALNQQRTSVNITNVVSADQVGRFPDANIGDALKRVPGINVQYDQGEARFGHVRGTPPEFNSVTVNGNRIPSAEAETRSVQLDLVPSDMIQTVEVNKVVTPDMDADAIGGSINLVTKSNPYKQRISGTLGGGYNYLVDKMQYTAGALYGNRFKTGEDSSFGMIFSYSYQKNDLGSDNIEADWRKAKDGSVYIKDFQQRTYLLMRERKSYSAAFDYKFNNNHKLELKGIYNHRRDWENRYRLRYRNMSKKKDGSWQAEIRRQTKGGVRDTKFRRLEDQKSMDFSLGGRHHLGSVRMDWKGAYAKASEERPNERYISYRARKINVSPDISDPRKPMVTVLDPKYTDLNSNFSLRKIIEEFRFTDEVDKNFKLDFRIPLAKGDYASKLRIGGRYRMKEKQRGNTFYEYKPKDKKSFHQRALYLGGIDVSKADYNAGSKYQAGHFVDRNFLGELDLNNPSKFSKEKVLEEEAGNFEAEENVLASYVRYDQKIGDKFETVAGIRIEKTNLEYAGRELIVNDKGKVEALNKTKSEKDNYVNILPSFIAKYEFSKNSQLKFGWTNTIARPRYYDLVPHSEMDLEDMKIKIGNPELKPTKAMNFDLIGEHYFESMGLVSAGVFYKQITDFIVEQQLEDYKYNQREWKRFVKPINGGDAQLYGFEFSFQRNLDFLPGFFKNFGFYGNYTYTKSKVENFQVEGRKDEELSLPGTPENTFNASLFYETKKITIRASLNYADEFIDEVGSSTFFDRYYDKATHLDFNVNYAINKNVNIFGEINNVLNQPLRYYQGIKERVMQEEYYGLKVNFGLKINL